MSSCQNFLVNLVDSIYCIRDLVCLDAFGDSVVSSPFELLSLPCHDFRDSISNQNYSHLLECYPRKSKNRMIVSGAAVTLSMFSDAHFLNHEGILSELYHRIQHSIRVRAVRNPSKLPRCVYIWILQETKTAILTLQFELIHDSLRLNIVVRDCYCCLDYYFHC